MLTLDYCVVLFIYQMVCLAFGLEKMNNISVAVPVSNRKSSERDERVTTSLLEEHVWKRDKVKEFVPIKLKCKFVFFKAHSVFDDAQSDEFVAAGNCYSWSSRCALQIEWHLLSIWITRRGIALNFVRKIWRCRYLSTDSLLSSTR